MIKAVAAFSTLCIGLATLATPGTLHAKRYRDVSTVRGTVLTPVSRSVLRMRRGVQGQVHIHRTIGPTSHEQYRKELREAQRERQLREIRLSHPTPAGETTHQMERRLLREQQKARQAQELRRVTTTGETSFQRERRILREEQLAKQQRAKRYRTLLTPRTTRETSFERRARTIRETQQDRTENEEWRYDSNNRTCPETSFERRARRLRELQLERLKQDLR